MTQTHIAVGFDWSDNAELVVIKYKMIGEAFVPVGATPLHKVDNDTMQELRKMANILLEDNAKD